VHNNYFFLDKLVENLRIELAGFSLTDCYSQSREELVFHFAKGTMNVFIKAWLRSDFTCLWFPENVSRARRNSVAIFPKIHGLKVLKIEMIRFDRSFLIFLENDFLLLFKMHGNRSNIILFEQGRYSAMFKNGLLNDRELVPESLSKKNPDFNEFSQASGDLMKCFPVVGKPLWNELINRGYSSLNIAEKWQQWQLMLSFIQNVKHYYVEDTGDEVRLSFYKSEGQAGVYGSPQKALNAFFLTYIKNHTLYIKKKQVAGELRKRLKKLRGHYEKAQWRLNVLNTQGKPAEVADTLMAYMHLIRPDMENVVLENVHTGVDISIGLKRGASVIKQAEALYRKSKNQAIEVQRLTESIKSCETELDELSLQLEGLDKVRVVDELEGHTHQKKPVEKQKAERFIVCEWMGFKIKVGKNAKNNDLLSFGDGKKDDLWLHAKDVSGSHVIIKQMPGQNYPAPVIEKAAQLAAFYSKRSTESLVPVIYTPRKYIRRRKGAPPGAVVVDREQVILVEPDKWI